MRIDAVLPQSPEAADRVERLHKLYAKDIKREIEDLTRLKTGHDKRDESGHKESLTVRWDYKVAHPTLPSGKDLEPFEEIIARLSRWRGDLLALRDSCTNLLTNHNREPDLTAAVDCVDDLEPVLTRAREIAERLLLEAEKDALLKRMKHVAETLGHCEPPTEKDKGNGQSIDLQLHWGFITFHHETGGLSLEGLVVYAAAHELAHAYLRCGYDASGNQWDEDAYGDTPAELREALADYYSLHTLERLGGLYPLVKNIYAEFHGDDPARLRIQTDWFPDYDPELVRHVMIPIRKTGEVLTLKEFERRLAEEKPKFAARKRRKKKGEPDLFQNGESDE